MPFICTHTSELFDCQGPEWGDNIHKLFEPLCKTLQEFDNEPFIQQLLSYRSLSEVLFSFSPFLLLSFSPFLLLSFSPSLLFSFSPFLLFSFYQTSVLHVSMFHPKAHLGNMVPVEESSLSVNQKRLLYLISRVCGAADTIFEGSRYPLMSQGGVLSPISPTRFQQKSMSRRQQRRMNNIKRVLKRVLSRFLRPGLFVTFNNWKHHTIADVSREKDHVLSKDVSEDVSRREEREEKHDVDNEWIGYLTLNVWIFEGIWSHVY